ncbi:cob(I)yrinic acid a,c-diamide adenosyltransferase [Neptunicella sp. SCSIO 80796]|uniref:cob(I)yrinic acid a,c-diamide adenosyltransferase n=1 Tax=Neptunicella plasticusilytica TaxID=3117012 RepID=UPI003A4DFF46
MKIYTKGGDKGETQIYADKPLRLKKSADELECYGTLDELNAHTGMLSALLAEHSPGLLNEIQTALFQIGFAISATSQLSDQDLAKLELAIDNMQASLPAQSSFILPGGSVAASQAHICRTVARRAERCLVRLTEQHQVADLNLSYINRLSDYFYVLARKINLDCGTAELRL